MTRRRALAGSGVALAVLVASLALAGPAAGLGAVALDEPGHVRLVLGDADPRWEALDGAPTVDGAPAPEQPEPVPEEGVEAWRGYERTVELILGGHGRLLVTANGTGLVLEAPGNETAASDPGEGSNASAPPPDPGPAEHDEEALANGDAAGGTGQAPAEPRPSPATDGDERGQRPSAQEHDRGVLAEHPVQAALLAGALVVAAAPTAWRLAQRLREGEGDAGGEAPAGPPRSEPGRGDRSSRRIGAGSRGSRQPRSRPRGARARRSEGPPRGGIGSREPRRKP